MLKILLLSTLTLVACGRDFSALEPEVEKSIENVTCADSQSYLYNVVYKSLVELNAVPTESDLRAAFEKALGHSSEFKNNDTQFLELVSEFYQILLNIPSQNPQDLLEKLTAVEIGDQTTEISSQAQSKIRVFEKKWKQYTSQLDVTCPNEPAPAVPPNPSLGQTPAPMPETSTPADPGASASPANSVHAISLNARAVLVTAYQSCGAGKVEPLNKNTPPVEGISRVGTHSDGVGGKRQITDLNALLRTNVYLSTLDSNANCQNIRSNPPIYDYGGKPYTTSDANSKLDLFKNAGSGTSVRGIDCSAFVFSAIASSGLKLDPDKKMKAILVHGINSRMYMNPAANGMRCFDKVKMGKSGSLKDGDIVAISGHVLLIDSVGNDPLGIQNAKTVSDCAKLTSKGFDFVVSQSSPSKNGIGINRYRGADYLLESSTIRNGFEAYARQACQAKFQGTDVTMTATNFQIIRHNLSQNCRDQRISLVGESCAQSCQPVASSQLQ